MNMRRFSDYLAVFRCEDITGSGTNQVPQTGTADHRPQGKEQQPQHTKDDRTDSGSWVETSQSDADRQLHYSQQRMHTKQYCERKVCITTMGEINDREDPEDDCQNQPTENQHAGNRPNIAFAVNQLLPYAHFALLKRIKRFRCDERRGVGIE